MDPSGVVQALSGLLAAWVVTALGLTGGLVLFFRGAHRKERDLPADAGGVQRWIQPRDDNHPRAA